jgi:hypothetical protein
MSRREIQINACRFCKIDSTQRRLFKYGVRHYACAPCGFRLFPNKGRDFLDKLPTHQLAILPYQAVVEAGWTLEQMTAYMNARQAADALRDAQANERAAQRYADAISGVDVRARDRLIAALKGKD